MNFEKKHLIFVSSTYIDLINTRRKVIESILTMNQIPIGMEMFSAGSYDQWTLIKSNLEITDYYILVIGQRYGSLSEEGIGYTEKEFDYAIEKQIPVLAFIQDRNSPTTPQERETDPFLQKKLDDFIAKVKKNKICDFWTNEDELAKKVSIALMKEFVKNPRVGWVRADSLLNLKEQVNLNIKSNVVEFLQSKKLQGLKEISIKGYELELNIFESYFSDQEVDKFNKKDILKYLSFRETNSINSKSSLERIRIILKMFFEWLIAEKKIDKNPFESIKSFSQSNTKLEVLNNEELNELRKACLSLREIALVETILSTGCKLSELTMLKIENIDWDREVINVIGDGKNSRVVFLNKEAQEAVRKYIDDREDINEFLFVTLRKPYSPLSNRGVQRELSTIVERTNLNKNISVSTLRNTFIKEMMKKNVPVNVIKTLLGHKLYSSTSNTFFKLT
jgi:site-specific recombinase XerD